MRACDLVQKNKQKQSTSLTRLTSWLWPPSFVCGGGGVAAGAGFSSPASDSANKPLLMLFLLGNSHGLWDLFFQLAFSIWCSVSRPSGRPGPVPARVI